MLARRATKEAVAARDKGSERSARSARRECASVVQDAQAQVHPAHVHVVYHDPAARYFAMRFVIRYRERIEQRGREKAEENSCRQAEKTGYKKQLPLLTLTDTSFGFGERARV